MARKQTLASLLGANDSRVQVDLDLDQQAFRAPTVSAGNYQVAAPQYSRTNSLTQLSDSLANFSGPILKGYAGIKEKQQIAMADATELLTPEQLKLLDAGDSSGLVESINADKDKLDEAQRKKLISFAENPNNYERAYRRVGSRVAGAFMEDYLSNPDKYAEEDGFDLNTKANELIEEYQLTGLGKEEFLKEINNINPAVHARFNELRNDHETREHKAETITDISLHFTNSTWSEDKWKKATNAGTVEENQDILLGLVTKLREESPAKADRVKELYENGGIKIGNGGISDEFTRKLENAIANEDERLDLIAKGVEKTRNESITSFKEITSNALITKEALPESLSIDVTSGYEMPVDLSNAKTAADVANAAIDAVNAIPKDDKTISIKTRQNIISQFTGEIEKQATATRDFRRAAGADNSSSKMLELFGTEDSEGNPVYEGMDNTDAITDKVIEKREELNEILDAIEQNPELDSAQKYAQAQRANMKFMVEVSREHEQFKNAKEESIKAVEFEKRTGGDQERFYVADVFTQVSQEKGDLAAMEQRPEIVAKAREFNAETERLREEIRKREMTDEEIASGMTSEQFFQKKEQEAKDLAVDRRALYQQDYGVDEEIDGVTSRKQIPKEVLKDQESINRDSETANVVIKESSGAGLAPTNFSIKNLDPDKPVDYGLKYSGDAIKSNPQTFRAINSTNLVEDINTPKAMGAEFKIGLFDNLRLTWITRNLPRKIDTIHKANQVRAIKFQEEGADYMDTEKGQSIVAEFVSGETMTRVIRDGEAGITIDELERGDLEGVAFNAAALNQSSTPILPFGLLNKAFLDGDNLTPQEEQQVRDYADALYDTSELNDKGRQVIINKMVELQVNAYTIIGFEFGK